VRRLKLCTLNEVFRVLKGRGKFIMVSHGGGEDRDDVQFSFSRMDLLKDDNYQFKWLTIETLSLPKPSIAPHQAHKVYVCTADPE